MINLLVIACFALIWFLVGVIAATVVNRAIAVATTYMKHFAAVAVATSTSTIKHAVATVAAVADGLVIAMAEDLTEPTSIYSLSVAAGSGEYAAGEYLVRDNGAWRNVYLTVHARALMGSSADVIALAPATVVNASGSSRVWTVAVPEFGLVPFAPIA